MTRTQIAMLAGMDEAKAVGAFSRILAERPDERRELLRQFRADLPDLYMKWLDHSIGRRDLSAA